MDSDNPASRFINKTQNFFKTKVLRKKNRESDSTANTSTTVSGSTKTESTKTGSAYEESEDSYYYSETTRLRRQSAHPKYGTNVDLYYDDDYNDYYEDEYYGEWGEDEEDYQSSMDQSNMAAAANDQNKTAGAGPSITASPSDANFVEALASGKEEPQVPKPSSSLTQVCCDCVIDCSLSIIACVCRIALVLINVIALCLCLLLMVLAVNVLTESGYVATLVDQVEVQYERYRNTTHVKSHAKFERDQVFTVLSPIAYLALFIGLVMLISSLFGIYSGIRLKKRALTYYFETCVTLLFTEIILVLFLFNYRIGLDAMKASLTPYNGSDGIDTYTIIWNGIMKKYKCCGAESYLDFHHLDLWPPSPYVRLNLTTDNKLKLIQDDMAIILGTPFVCCKKGRSRPTCAIFEDANENNNNMLKGCYNELHEKIFWHTYTILGVVGLFLFRILTIILTLIVRQNAAHEESGSIRVVY